MKNPIVTSYPLLRGRSYVRFVSGAFKINDLSLNDRFNDESKCEQKPSKSVKQSSGPTHFWTYCLLPLLLIIFSSTSFASDLYITAGAGLSRHETNGTDGVWVQKYFDHSIQSNSWTGQAGAGVQINDWLAVEGLYHDFGRTKISSDFVFNDDNYNPDSPNGCNGKCNPLAHGEGVGHATGMSLSLMPSYQFDRDWYVYSRLGILWYKRKWEEKVTCCKAGTYNEESMYGPRLHESFTSLVEQSDGTHLWKGDGYPVTPRSSGRALIWGIGLRYRKASVEYMGTKGIVAPGSGHTNLGTLTISYRVRF